MSSSEKASSDHKVEDITHLETAADVDARYEKGFVARTLRMLDLRMLPLLGALYAVALIDRGNMGVARIAGMDVDLKLYVGERFSIATMIYFIPYSLLQLPSNLMLRTLGARNWLTVCVIGWGAAQLGMGFVPTWGYLILCRVLLGVFEAGFFPAVVFIISCWYIRREVQRRVAVFYLTSMVICAFSSIFAYALTLLKGKAGYNGWAWIFIIEGAITVVLGIMAFFVLPDFPDKAKFVTDEQRKLVLDRIQADRRDAMPDEITREKVFRHLRDPFMWCFAYLFLSATVPAYAIGFFTPIILGGMGYGVRDSLLMTAPPGLVGAVSVYFFAWLSDKTMRRALWLGVQVIMIIVGLACVGFAKPNGARYFGIFLANCGASGCVPGVLAYAANNITSHSKRAVQTAIVVASGGIGGILATTIFAQKDYPTYRPGIYATIGFEIGSLIVLALVTVLLGRRNKLRREGKIGLLEDTEGFYYTL